MSITRYIAEAGLTAGTTAVALERLRNRRIVNRYDGSTVVDNADGITGVDTSANITLSSAVSIPTGYNVFVDRTITIQDTFNSNAANTHLSFFNCTVILESTAGNPGPLTVSSGALNSVAVQSSVDTGQTAGRSLNFYGCNLFINSAAGNFFQMFSDFMDSNMTFAQWDGATAGPRIPLPSFIVGSRVINGTFYGSTTHFNAVLEIYGIPDVVEGLDVFRMSLEYAGQAGQGSLMFVEPNFSSPENQRRWRVQGPGGDNLISSVGFFSPLDNTLANAFTTDNNAPAYFRTADGANGGQLYNYYAWRHSFFSDVALTNAIPGVRVRSTSNIPLNATAETLNAAETNLSGAFSGTASTINQTGLATNVVNDFVTDANGVPVADATSRVSVDGGTTFTDSQWYDWMRFSRVNTASTTTGGETLATNFNGQDFPNGVIAVPIQRFASNAYNQFTATYEARSYTHNVNTGIVSQNGIIGTAAGNQPSNVPVAIENVVGVAETIAYVNNTEAQALALFDTAGDKTATDVSQFIRAQWASYETGVQPTDSGSMITWPGAVTFDSADTASTLTGTTAVLNRIDELVAGTIDELSATSFEIDTDVTGVDLTATGNINLGTGNTITGSTLTAASFSNFPTTLDGSITFVGTNTFSGTSTLTVTDRSNLSGLTLNVPTGVTLNIAGASAGDFAAITGAGTVNYVVSYLISNDRTAGLLSVFRNGTLETLTDPTIIPNIQPNDVIDVVYTETGRTDFLRRIDAGATPSPETIMVMNAPTPYPSSAVSTVLLVPLAPADYTFPGALDPNSNPLGGMTRVVMQINVLEPAISETEVSTALQEQVKGTLNYNTLIQMVQIVDLIQSSGSQGVAAANGDHVLFTSMIPAQVGYVDPIGQDENSQALSGATVTGTFTPTGGSPTNLTIGVVMQQIAAFDPAVTGGQINDAVEAINNNTDAEFDQVATDVREMRDNRLLGLKPQPARTS